MTAASTNIAAAFALGYMMGNQLSREDTAYRMLGLYAPHNIAFELASPHTIDEIGYDLEDDLAEITANNPMFTLADMENARDEILRQAEPHTDTFAVSTTELIEDGGLVTYTTLHKKPDIPDAIPAELTE